MGESGRSGCVVNLVVVVFIAATIDALHNEFFGFKRTELITFVINVLSITDNIFYRNHGILLDWCLHAAMFPPRSLQVIITLSKQQNNLFVEINKQKLKKHFKSEPEPFEDFKCPVATLSIPSASKTSKSEDLTEMTLLCVPNELSTFS